MNRAHRRACASIAFCLAAALTTGAAAAQAAKARAEPLARSTFLATMDSEYRKMDANRDGTVTRAELETHQRKVAEAAAAERARTLFSRIDTDRDGKLSAEEFTRAHVGQSKSPDVAAVISRLDGNRDQKVTLVEYRTLTLASFDRLDADKDGILSEAEQRAGGFVR